MTSRLVSMPPSEKEHLALPAASPVEKCADVCSQ